MTETTSMNARPPAATDTGRGPNNAAALIAADILAAARRSKEPAPDETPTPQPARDAAIRFGEDQHPISTVAAIVGRDPGPAGHSIADRHASRLHFQVQLLQGYPTVVDLGSTNGTAIVRDGRRFEVAAQPLAVEPGDLIVTVNNVTLASIVSGSLN